MNDLFDEVNELVNDIVNEELNVVGTQNRINDIKRKYGNNCFPSIHFDKKPQPWDKGYLMELKAKNVTGACSEEFLLHMAEVGENIRNKKIKFVLLTVVIILITILFLMLCIVF